MTDKEEKKGFFRKIGDALSSKDEKEALAKTQAELEAAKKAAAEAEVQKKRLEVVEANRKRIEEANKVKADAEKKRLEVEAANRKRVEEAEKMKAAAEARRAEFEARKLEAEELAKKTAIIAEHTVQSDETLSHIALKYYKHATPPYYMHIYEANKEVIGDNPNIIRPGMVLKITVLPEELQK